MVKSLNQAKDEFDHYILELKSNDIYISYVKAKEILDNCEEATETLNQIKDLQKARHKANSKEKDDISNKIEDLHNTYDSIFEVAQFNYCYDNLKNEIEKLKQILEKTINEEVL